MVAPRARASVNNIMHFDTCNNAGDRATFAAASSDPLSLLGFDGCSLALIDELIRKGTHLPYCPPFGSTIGMEQREAISLEFGYILNGLDSLTYMRQLGYHSNAKCCARRILPSRVPYGA